MLKFWAIMGAEKTSKEAHMDVWKDVVEAWTLNRLPSTAELDSTVITSW